MIFSSSRRLFSHALFDPSDLGSGQRTRNEAIIRSLCAVAPLGQGDILCRALGRYKMFVDPDDLGFSSHIMLDGYWEMWVTEMIAHLVKPDMIVADIGANLGYFSLLMADLVGPRGFVHAFEPNPAIARRLRMSLEVNGFASRSAVEQVALSDAADAKMALVVPPHEPKNAFLMPEGEGLPVGAAHVRTARLDGDPRWADIDFAKIDVEGAEELVWAGAKGLLDGGRLRTIILEFAAARYADPARFLGEIVAHGFSLAYIDLRQGRIRATVADILALNPLEDVMLLLQR